MTIALVQFDDVNLAQCGTLINPTGTLRIQATNAAGHSGDQMAGKSGKSPCRSWATISQRLLDETHRALLPEPRWVTETVRMTSANYLPHLYHRRVPMTWSWFQQQ